jgi:hypothetical protein
MAKRSQRRELAALGFGTELDEVFRRANPNPTREGCPPPVLVALSRRERPIGDPWGAPGEVLACYLRGARHAVGTTRNGRLLLARGAVQGSAFRGPAHPAWGDDEGVTSTRSGVSDNSAFSDSRQPLPPSTQSGPYLFIRRCSSCARIARVSAIRCTIPSRPRVSWSLTAVPGAASAVSISRR